MTLLPDILAETRDGQTVRIKLRVPLQLVHFSGHFPAQPILPGVIEIDWAVRLAERHFALPRQRFSQLKNVKFTSPVLPGTLLDCILNWSEEKFRLEFSFAAGGRPCSSGQIVFPAGTAA